MLKCSHGALTELLLSAAEKDWEVSGQSTDAV